ncbi:hypothetical protein RHGRI_026336 [Rhododendron griersonianum]|uniref:Uncharacterized protein n=1 Tax=Rhododendron griersonianum TaxID=479676 RepID=A0AAV6IXC7_9ERIC|nr:hypothetical protein RHGRI_026336 [Rhododendron griersonianum]
MDVVHTGMVPRHKVNFDAKIEYEMSRTTRFFKKYLTNSRSPRFFRSLPLNFSHLYFSIYASRVSLISRICSSQFMLLGFKALFVERKWNFNNFALIIGFVD